MGAVIDIDAAGTVVGIRCEDGGLGRAIKTVYRPFTTGLPADIEVVARAVSVLDSASLDRRGIRHTLNERDTLYLRGDGFCGEVRLGLGSGELQVLAERPVEAFGLAFRHLFTRLAVEGGWSFVHAAGVVRGGKAFLFAGPSGAGKTTVAGMLDGVEVVHDDTVFLGSSGGDPAIRAVPFMGNRWFVHDRRAEWPVEAVYFLAQDTRAFVRPVSPGVAAGRLMAAPLEWIDDPPESFREWLQNTLDSCAGLAGRARCAELHFSLSELPEGLMDSRRSS